MRVFAVVVLLLCVYAVGLLTGYALGYGDRYTVEVVKYRRGR